MCKVFCEDYIFLEYRFLICQVCKGPLSPMPNATWSLPTRSLHRLWQNDAPPDFHRSVARTSKAVLHPFATSCVPSSCSCSVKAGFDKINRKWQRANAFFMLSRCRPGPHSRPARLRCLLQPAGPRRRDFRRGLGHPPGLG